MARGLNGPNLIALFAAGRTDERILQTIRYGVPGSIMPPSTATDAELRAILGYIKALRRRHRPPRYYAPHANADAITLVTNDGREIHGERRTKTPSQSSSPSRADACVGISSPSAHHHSWQPRQAALRRIRCLA